MMNALRIVLIAALVQSGAAQQNSTASIEGVVVEVSSGRPIPGAVVELTGVAATQDWRVFSLSTVTSFDGKFVIEGVPPGNGYQLVVTHLPGFAASVHGQTRADDAWVPISLTAGQRLTGVRITLRALSSVSGRVVDRAEKAVRRIGVVALAVSYRDGQKVLEVAGRTLSNEDGEYRIAGLAPGRYVIRLGPAKGASSSTPGKASSEAVNPYIYFPNAIDPDNSVVVEVNEAMEVDGLNFVAAPTLTRRIRGVVSSEGTGRIVRDARVFLVPLKATPDSSIAREIRSSNGEFDFRGVAPGMYEIFVVTEGGGPPLSGRISIEVGGSDLRDIKLVVRPDVDVAGRIVVADGTPSDVIDFSKILVTLYAESRGTIDGSFSPGLPTEKRAVPVVPTLQLTPARDGTFTLKDVRSWLYYADASATAAAPGAMSRIYVKSIRVGPRDVLREGQPFDPKAEGTFEIVLGTDSGELDGRVLDGNRHGMPHSVVVLVPDEPFRSRRDLYRSVKAEASGSFRLETIAPGSYKAFAWRVVDNGAWFFPEFLKPYEGASPSVTISPSGKGYLEAPLLPALPAAH